MTYRDELNRPANIDTSSENNHLRSMEAAALVGNRNGASRLMGTKWFSVFVNADGVFTYDWQGGYPTSKISRETAVQVLARA
jgi:hypothetical protein